MEQLMAYVKGKDQFPDGRLSLLYDGMDNGQVLVMTLFSGDYHYLEILDSEEEFLESYEWM